MSACCLILSAVKRFNCCKSPGEQYTNLWYACSFLGSLPYLMRTVSIFVCHDDFEEAYVQWCHHNLDAPGSGCVFFDVNVSVFPFANISRQTRENLFLGAVIKVTNNYFTDKTMFFYEFSSVFTCSEFAGRVFNHLTI